jgi:hypothetical protein
LVDLFNDQGIFCSLNNMSTDTKPERFVKTLTLKPEAGAWVEEQAAKENRSVSNFIDTMILRHKAQALEAEANAAQEEVEP